MFDNIDPHHTTPELGIFEGMAAIGMDQGQGTVKYLSDASRYILSGGGNDIWGRKDEFAFLWKRWSGDVSFSSDIKLLGSGKHFHRKACLMLRTSLEPDAVYADIAIHADGLVTLQHRDTVGGLTVDTQSNLKSPRRLTIEKIGDQISILLTLEDGVEQFAGASIKLPLDGEFFLGLGVCSHERSEIETAIFSNVTIQIPTETESDRMIYSSLEVITAMAKGRRIVACVPYHVEAPNWTPDGRGLLINSKGLLYRVPAIGGTPDHIDTGFANRCNNDHGISPDGSRYVISDQSQEPFESVIYVVPAEGGTPRRVTERYPSYWHGWSPDGQTLAFCGKRDGKFGIFTIPADGGEELRLTITDGLDDGPDYSHDGQFIYFNSDRSGSMQIWRMRTDGTELTQMTADEFNNWFPHPSPDGQWLSFVSYLPEVVGHPPDQEVQLRLLNLETGVITVLADLLGGQGTINVPSWAPCSQRLAFVSYHYR